MRENIIGLLNKINREDVLSYISIIVKDIVEELEKDAVGGEDNE